MGLPIITTDMGFAHDVCHDAALYYPPRSVQGAAAAIFRLLDDGALWERQIDRGKEVLLRFPTSEERYRAYVRVLSEFKAGGKAVAVAES